MNARMFCGIALAATVVALYPFAFCNAEETGGVDASLRVTGEMRSIGPPRNQPLSGATDPRSITLTLKNDSGKAIILPAGYDGVSIRLYGYPTQLSADSEGSWTFQRIAAKKVVGTVRIDPKNSVAVFSLPLNEVLTSTWKLKSQPKSDVGGTPIVPRPQERRVFSYDAVLWAEITIDKQIIRTPPIVVIVKRDD